MIPLEGPAGVEEIMTVLQQLGEEVWEEAWNGKQIPSAFAPHGTVHAHRTHTKAEEPGLLRRLWLVSFGSDMRTCTHPKCLTSGSGWRGQGSVIHHPWLHTAYTERIWPEGQDPKSECFNCRKRCSSLGEAYNPMAQELFNNTPDPVEVDMLPCFCITCGESRRSNLRYGLTFQRSLGEHCSFIDDTAHEPGGKHFRKTGGCEPWISDWRPNDGVARLPFYE